MDIKEFRPLATRRDVSMSEPAFTLLCIAFLAVPVLGCAAAQSETLRFHNGAMSGELDPAKCELALADGSTAWTLRGSYPGFAYITFYRKEPASITENPSVTPYVVGGAGEGSIPIDWAQNGPNGIVGTGVITKEKVSFKIVFNALSHRRLQCRIDLEGDSAGNVANVIFPSAPVISDSRSRMVVPQWLGLLVSPGGPDINVRRTVWLRPWCMRFIGATQWTPQGDRSYVSIVTDSLYRSVDIWRRDNVLGFNYVGDRAYPEKTANRRSQEMTFEFLDGNYVDIAKRYRAWAQEQPTWRTLATRLRPCRPDVVGGAIHFSHVPCDYGGDATPFGDLIPRIQALKAAGIERAVFHLGGWNRQGYDAEYPDILPANPRCGGDEEMRRLAKAIDDLGYLCMPHDDLGIMSTIAPSYDEKWTAHWFDHSQINGGVYRNAQNYMTNSAAQLHFAERNTPEIRKRYPEVRGYLYDVVTSTQPIEDHTTDPPVLKEQDLKLRAEAFRVTRENFAEFTLSESIVDWAIEYTDAGHMAEEGYVHRGDGGWSTDALHGEIVPMWELVYHDAYLAVRDASNHVNTKMDTDDPLVRYLRVFLKTLRAGATPPSFFGDNLTLNFISTYCAESATHPAGWPGLNGRQTVVTVSRLSTWLADNVFYAPMVDHRFIDGNLFHERTEFDGKGGRTVVYVNTAPDSWSPFPGVTLAPLGFWIKGPQLLAYCALEAGGTQYTEPTLAAFRGDFRTGRTIRAYRAFGDEKVRAPRDGGYTTIAVGEACKTLDVKLP
jgi:hypothetical protein